MRSKVSATCLLFGVLFVAAAAACSDSTGVPPAAIVQISMDSMVSVPGVAINLDVLAIDPDTPIPVIVLEGAWTSSDTTVATVDSNGVVRFLTEGSALIVYAARTGADTFSLRLVRPTYREIAVSDDMGATCAISTDDDVFCWGGSVRIGENRFQNAGFPVRVLHVPGASNLVIGWYHMCMLVGTEARCWGSNDYGYLGRGSSDNDFHEELAPVANPADYATLSGGLFRTCGTGPGGVRCWGFGYIASSAGVPIVQAAPALVDGGPFTAISSARYESYLLDSAGHAFAWDWFGAAPVPVAPAYAFTQVSYMGGQACGLTGLGQLICFRGSIRDRSSGLSLASITAGLDHACGLTAAGKAYCFGFNEYGQLGIGVQDQFHGTLEPVAGNLTFVSLRAGGHYTCGLTAPGRVYCWGYNLWGSLGVPSTDETYVYASPQLVTGQP